MNKALNEAYISNSTNGVLEDLDSAKYVGDVNLGRLNSLVPFNSIPPHLPCL